MVGVIFYPKIQRKEAYLCLWFFSVRRTRSRHRRGRSWGLGGYPSTSVLAGFLPAKIANMYMFALLAEFVPNSGQIWLYRKSDYPEYFKESQ